MPEIISMQTALRIWNAHREIEAGRALLADMQQAIKDGTDPNPLDAFGRRRQLQLGVPSGGNGHRLLDVSKSFRDAFICSTPNLGTAISTLFTDRSRQSAKRALQMIAVFLCSGIIAFISGAMLP